MIPRLLSGLAALTGLGVATLGYSALIERNNFALRRFDVPVLPAGSRTLRILHLSDLHLTAAQERKVAWVRSLASLEPELIITTGDNLAGVDAIPTVVRALEPFMGTPGAFVWGNNDYFAPILKSPHNYLTHRKEKKRRGRRLPLGDLQESFEAAGWLNLNNARGSLQLEDLSIVFGGVDDPHLRRARYAEIAGVADPSAGLRLGLLHSPDPDLLNHFTDDGYDLMLAGHTHGGQVRVPGYGAIVTNCGIDRVRARWLSTWDSPAGNRSYLHVSAGLGTSPYAPIRFACRPEATLLTLVPRSA